MRESGSSRACSSLASVSGFDFRGVLFLALGFFMAVSWVEIAIAMAITLLLPRKRWGIRAMEEPMGPG